MHATVPGSGTPRKQVVTAAERSLTVQALIAGPAQRPVPHERLRAHAPGRVPAVGGMFVRTGQHGDQAPDVVPGGHDSSVALTRGEGAGVDLPAWFPATAPVDDPLAARQLRLLVRAS